MANNCKSCKYYIPAFEYLTEPYYDEKGYIVRPKSEKSEEICGKNHNSRLKNKISCPYAEVKNV